ncbi:MAG: HEAT repeat domain-containing protein [Caulobacterales bacterium]
MRSVGRNSYQKAAHKAGEARVRRGQVDQLLALAGSDRAEDRLVAAKFLCPCHVRGRTQDIWNAIVALMADEDARIRFAAWHTLEDGGVPSETGVLEQLEGLLARESDPGVRRMAKETIGPSLEQRDRQELRHMTRPQAVMWGKCDFCGERDVVVRADLETRIPTDGLSRPALICRRCDAPTEAAKGFARRA